MTTYEHFCNKVKKENGRWICDYYEKECTRITLDEVIDCRLHEMDTYFQLRNKDMITSGRKANVRFLRNFGKIEHPICRSLSYIKSKFLCFVCKYFLVNVFDEHYNILHYRYHSRCVNKTRRGLLIRITYLKNMIKS